MTSPLPRVWRTGAWRLALLLTFTAACGPSDPSGPRSGYITGTVLDARGNPISIPGAQPTVNITGHSDKLGVKVVYNPLVNADGTYEAKVLDGTYQPLSGAVEVLFNQFNYRLELHPVQDNSAQRHSKDGIVQDFVWKLSGPRYRYLQNPDPTDPTHWYGGSVRVRLSSWRNDLNQAVVSPPAGTRYVFTLRPASQLFDGSDAQELKFERTWMGSDLDNNLLHDIPLGIYKLTGTELVPAGTQRTVLFETSSAQFETEATVDFPYSETLDGPQVHVHQFDFDRQ
jgi:hypothetical protein